MDSVRPSPTPPGADPEERRRAYLDLLKLALCDLVAPSTSSVETTPSGPVSYVLSEEDVALRVAGKEWPLQGLTMIGYDRLADLQACVESVVADGIEGDTIEAGVWRGGASILVRATLDSLGMHDRAVWVADSFQGLPPPDAAFPEDRDMTLHAHDYLAVPRPDVQAGFRRLGLDHDLEFVEGFFSDTMPGLAGRRWSLIRLDGDMYESTWVTLEALYPGLAQGGYVIFDDYGAISEGRRAMDDFRAAHGIETPIEWVDHTCVRWRREDEPGPIEVDDSKRRVRQEAAAVSRPAHLVVRPAEVAELERALADQASQHAGEIKAYEDLVAEMGAVKPLFFGVRARLRNRLRRN